MSVLQRDFNINMLELKNKYIIFLLNLDLNHTTVATCVKVAKLTG